MEKAFRKRKKIVFEKNMEEELAGFTKLMRYLTLKQESKAIPDYRSA